MNVGLNVPVNARGAADNPAAYTVNQWDYRAMWENVKKYDIRHVALWHLCLEHRGDYDTSAVFEHCYDVLGHDGIQNIHIYGYYTHYHKDIAMIPELVNNIILCNVIPDLFGTMIWNPTAQLWSYGQEAAFKTALHNWKHGVTATNTSALSTIDRFGRPRRVFVSLGDPSVPFRHTFIDGQIGTVHLQKMAYKDVLGNDVAADASHPLTHTLGFQEYFYDVSIQYLDPDEQEETAPNTWQHTIPLQSATEIMLINRLSSASVQNSGSVTGTGWSGNVTGAGAGTKVLIAHEVDYSQSTTTSSPRVAAAWTTALSTFLASEFSAHAGLIDGFDVSLMGVKRNAASYTTMAENLPELLTGINGLGLPGLVTTDAFTPTLLTLAAAQVQPEAWLPRAFDLPPSLVTAPFTPLTTPSVIYNSAQDHTLTDAYAAALSNADAWEVEIRAYNQLPKPVYQHFREHFDAVRRFFAETALLKSILVVLGASIPAGASDVAVARELLVPIDASHTTRLQDAAAAANPAAELQILVQAKLDAFDAGALAGDARAAVAANTDAGIFELREGYALMATRLDVLAHALPMLRRLHFDVSSGNLVFLGVPVHRNMVADAICVLYRHLVVLRHAEPDMTLMPGIDTPANAVYGGTRNIAENCLNAFTPSVKHVGGTTGYDATTDYGRASWMAALVCAELLHYSEDSSGQQTLVSLPLSGFLPSGASSDAEVHLAIKLLHRYLYTTGYAMVAPRPVATTTTSTTAAPGVPEDPNAVEGARYGIALPSNKLVATQTSLFSDQTPLAAYSFNDYDFRTFWEHCAAFDIVDAAFWNINIQNKATDAQHLVGTASGAYLGNGAAGVNTDDTSFLDAARILGYRSIASQTSNPSGTNTGVDALWRMRDILSDDQYRNTNLYGYIGNAGGSAFPRIAYDTWGFDNKPHEVDAIPEEFNNIMLTFFDFDNRGKVRWLPNSTTLREIATRPTDGTPPQTIYSDDAWYTLTKRVDANGADLSRYTYTVQSGDTLTSIVNRADVHMTLDELRALNQIKKGQVLNPNALPAESVTLVNQDLLDDPAYLYAIHAVAPNDSYSSIATNPNYDVTVEQLILLNSFAASAVTLSPSNGAPGWLGGLSASTLNIGDIVLLNWAVTGAWVGGITDDNDAVPDTVLLVNYALENTRQTALNTQLKQWRGFGDRHGRQRNVFLSLGGATGHFVERLWSSGATPALELQKIPGRPAYAHEVGGGDTLSSIANALGFVEGTIVALNEKTPADFSNFNAVKNQFTDQNGALLTWSGDLSASTLLPGNVVLVNWTMVSVNPSSAQTTPAAMAQHVLDFMDEMDCINGLDLDLEGASIKNTIPYIREMVMRVKAGRPDVIVSAVPEGVNVRALPYYAAGLSASTTQHSGDVYGHALIGATGGNAQAVSGVPDPLIDVWFPQVYNNGPSIALAPLTPFGNTAGSGAPSWRRSATQVLTNTPSSSSYNLTLYAGASSSPTSTTATATENQQWQSTATDIVPSATFSPDASPSNVPIYVLESQCMAITDYWLRHRINVANALRILQVTLTAAELDDATDRPQQTIENLLFYHIPDGTAQDVVPFVPIDARAPAYAGTFTYAGYTVPLFRFDIVALSYEILRLYSTQFIADAAARAQMIASMTSVVAQLQNHRSVQCDTSEIATLFAQADPPHKTVALVQVATVITTFLSLGTTGASAYTTQLVTFGINASSVTVTADCQTLHDKLFT